MDERNEDHADAWAWFWSRTWTVEATAALASRLAFRWARRLPWVRLGEGGTWGRMNTRPGEDVRVEELEGFAGMGEGGIHGIGISVWTGGPTTVPSDLARPMTWAAVRR